MTLKASGRVNLLTLSVLSLFCTPYAWGSDAYDPVKEAEIKNKFILEAAEDRNSHVWRGPCSVSFDCFGASVISPVRILVLQILAMLPIFHFQTSLQAAFPIIFPAVKPIQIHLNPCMTKSISRVKTTIAASSPSIICPLLRNILQRITGII